MLETLSLGAGGGGGGGGNLHSHVMSTAGGVAGQGSAVQ